MASTSDFNQRPGPFNNEGGRFVNNSTYTPALGSTPLTPWVPSVPGVPNSSQRTSTHGWPMTAGDSKSSFPDLPGTKDGHTGLDGSSSQEHPGITAVEPSNQSRLVPASQGGPYAPDQIVITVTHDRASYADVDITSHMGDAQAIRREIASKITNNPHLKFNIYRVVSPEFKLSVALDDDELLVTCLQFGDSRGTLKLFVGSISSAISSDPVSRTQAPQYSPHFPTVPPTRISMPEPALTGGTSSASGSNSNSAAVHVVGLGQSRSNYQDPITNPGGNLPMPEPEHTSPTTQQPGEPDPSRFSVPYYEGSVNVATTPRTSISSLPGPSTPPVGQSNIARNTLHSEPHEMTETELINRSSRHSADATAVGRDADYPPNQPIRDQAPDGVRGTISRRMTMDEVLHELYHHGCRNATPYLNRSMSGDCPVTGGGFGDIYRGALNNGAEVGLKCVRLDVDLDDGGRKKVKDAARELYIWSKCKHPNVLELIGVTQHRNQIAMVSPWMENGDLTRFLHTHPEVDRYSLCAQIADGVAYLHQEKVVHGDLKAANILVSRDHTPKIADFGTARRHEYTLQFTETRRTTSMTIRWTAPELISEVADKISTETDVFSLGMTILEVITGTVPYHGVHEGAVVLRLVTGDHPERPEVHMPTGNSRADHLWSLLVDCWALKPQDRPTAIEVRDRMRAIASM